MPSMLFELNVEFEDGQNQVVVADQRDMAKWENQPFGCAATDFESKSMSGFRFLAWSALDRKGLTKLKWTEFDKLVIEVMPVGDEESELPGDAEDPFQSAP